MSTPKYIAVAYYRTPQGKLKRDELSWNGQATDTKAEDFRQKYNQSFQPGGVNFRLSKDCGYVPHYFLVEVRTNNDGRVIVAEARAPLFEVA